MKNPPRNRKVLGWGFGVERGFSLVELLIASAIVALTGSLLVGGLMAANRNSELRAQQALAAQQVAGHIALLPDQLAKDAPAQTACPESTDESCTIEQADAPLAPLKQLTLTLTVQGHTTHAVTLRPVAEQ